MKTTASIFSWMALLVLTGCGGDRVQSVLHPAAPEAAEIAKLWWFMFYVCTAVFILVIALLAWGLMLPRRDNSPPPPGGNTGFVVAGGIIMPTVVLIGMLVYSLKVVISQKPPEDALTIQVTGFQWWWDVYYPQESIRTANELYIPAGRKVRLELKAGDVIHSFWVPNLHGKMDLLPEKPNVWYLHAQRPGIFRGQCAEYCGVQHALMALFVVALPESDFQRWIEERKRPLASLGEPALARGQRVFFEAGCNNCHAIRGTPAAGRIGPDLTHIGSRLSLGAGTLTNSYGHLSGWVSNPQPLKPGNLMPATYLNAEELHALVSYLEALR